MVTRLENVAGLWRIVAPVSRAATREEIDLWHEVRRLERLNKAMLRKCGDKRLRENRAAAQPVEVPPADGGTYPRDAIGGSHAARIIKGDM